MSNKLTIGERPNHKNIKLLDLTQKVNLLRLWRGKVEGPWFPPLGKAGIQVSFKDGITALNQNK